MWYNTSMPYNKVITPFTVLDPLVAQGLTIKQIAEILNLSVYTTTIHLKFNNLKTLPGRKRIHADRQDGETDNRECKLHGLTTFIFYVSQGKFRCRACLNTRVGKTRRKNKQELIAKFGGKCIDCGYSKSIWALQFDHVDPTNKVASVAEYLSYNKPKEASLEAEKCELVCANCHFEREERRYLAKNRDVV